MKPSKHRFCGLILLLALMPFANAIADGKVEAAQRAALDWLVLVDTGQYQASWNEAASLFRNAVSVSQWQQAVSAARSPLGSLVSRNLISATFATTLPGAPDGEYVVLQFRSVFDNKSQAVETVTPMLDEGRWRVSGYYVR